MVVAPGYGSHILPFTRCDVCYCLPCQGESPWSEESITECLDGFILIADSDGVILYVTESVSLFLGLTQVR